jgi:hypothetical protein
MWGVCPGESKSMAESRKNRIAGFFGELLKMVRLVALFFGLYFGIYLAGAVFGLLEVNASLKPLFTENGVFSPISKVQYFNPA